MTLDLETNFEKSLEALITSYNPGGVAMNYEHLTKPIRIKLGTLRSDFRIGLSKFFNKNSYDSLWLYQ
jgi:hypothetical protein